jgi:glycosyltransferase involved in cell wall biosynthesis
MAYWLQFYTPTGFSEKVIPMLRNVDILHLHTFRNLLNDRLARTAYAAKIPFILTGHGTIPIIERFHKIKHLYDFLIGQWQLEHAAAVIAVSEAEKTKLKAFGISDSKIFVIPNGLPSIPTIQRGCFRKKWKISPDQKLILFLGKITERKGLQFVVEALSKVNDAKLVIAGNNMGYERRVMEIVNRLKIKDRIIRTGLLNDQEKVEALTDADVCVYPSRDEAFGLVAAESILCGTPVIVGDDDGCAQMIRNIGCGDLVKWGNSDELAAAIQQRISNKPSSSEMKKAREILVSEYNWKVIADQTLKLYQHLMS